MQTGRNARARGRVLTGLLALAVAAAAGPSEARQRLEIAGESSPNGIFDPSFEVAPGGDVGWLSYSAVYGGAVPFGPSVETRLARTLDGGAHFEFVQVVNPSTPATLTLGDGSTVTGVWNYEVSSLVHDPGDPGREWKLFAHRVFRRDESPFTEELNLPAYSWIVMRTAADPAGAWSPEVALFGAGPLPPPPFDGFQVAVNELHPTLESLLVYSEPGAFEADGVLYLSLTGLVATGADRIVLLASDDHGESWRWAGTPLANVDAPPLGYLSFDGSAIAEQDGRVFLLVTPESPGVIHDGTLVFEFRDLARGRLWRDGVVPIVRRHIRPRAGFPLERRGGQADFHELGAAAGLLQPSIQVGQAEMFQIDTTGQPLVFAEPVPALGAAGRGLAGVALLIAGRKLAASRASRSPAR